MVYDVFASFDHVVQHLVRVYPRQRGWHDTILTWEVLTEHKTLRLGYAYRDGCVIQPTRWWGKKFLLLINPWMGHLHGRAAETSAEMLATQRTWSNCSCLVYYIWQLPVFACLKKVFVILSCVLVSFGCPILTMDALIYHQGVQWGILGSLHLGSHIKFHTITTAKCQDWHYKSKFDFFLCSFQILCFSTKISCLCPQICISNTNNNLCC